MLKSPNIQILSIGTLKQPLRLLASLELINQHFYHIIYHLIENSTFASVIFSIFQPRYYY